MSRKPTSTRCRRRSSVAETAAARDAVDQARHAPVSFPSGGSYDAGRLLHGGGLDQVVDKQPENRDAEVGKALKAAENEDAPRTHSQAVNTLPGHHTARAEVELSPGTIVGEGKDKKEIGGVTVTELRQVYTPTDDDSDESAVAPVAAGQAVAGGQSVIKSIERVADGAPAPTSAASAVPAEDAETGEPGTTSDIEAKVSETTTLE